MKGGRCNGAQVQSMLEAGRAVQDTHSAELELQSAQYAALAAELAREKAAAAAAKEGTAMQVRPLDGHCRGLLRASRLSLRQACIMPSSSQPCC